MKKALISPIEQRENGFRVAQIVDESFDVAEPFFWVDCLDDLIADSAWYDPTTGEFVRFPNPASPTSNQPISQDAQML